MSELEDLKQEVGSLREDVRTVLARLNTMNGALSERCKAHGNEVATLRYITWALVAAVVAVALKVLVSA